MTTLRISTFACLTILILLTACSGDAVAPPAAEESIAVAPVACAPRRAGHATGELQLVWQGGGGAGAPADSARTAVADFAVHAADRDRPDRGTFVFRVVAGDGTPHREVTAAVDGVVIDPDARRVWFTGVVTADSKGCAGGPGGGHADGCGEDGDTGCTDGHEGGHDGGCTGDHDEGGCTGGGETGGEVGGCPDGTHEDGGCPEGSHDAGGAGGPAGASGRSCRVGQVIVVKAHDGGTPGAAVDGITWKWFLADDPDRPTIDDLAAWPHLCRKTITGGNLVIHAEAPTDARRAAEFD